MRTRVAIIGAGPAGLLLSHLLALRGIESVIVERQSRDYVQARLRAGVLEQGTVDLLTDAGVGDRLHAEGLRHDGIYLQWPGNRQHIDFPDLCGRSVWVYGQTEVVKDLISARLAAGQQIEFGVTDTAIHGVDSDSPQVTFTDSEGIAQTLTCEVVAGCDGFHGPARDLIPSEHRQSYERSYPYSWLGVLAKVPPSTDELIYAWHPNGFAMHSMRSPEISRLYLQVPADDSLVNWSDDRIWSELSTRMSLDGWELQAGPLLDKSITPMRSFVSTPMRQGGSSSPVTPRTSCRRPVRRV